MLLSLVNILVILIVGFIFIRRGPDRRVGEIRSARWLRIAGMVPLAAVLLLYLFFGIGEMASGDLSGAAHLLPAAAIALLAFLVWKRPLEGGAALIAGAALYFLIFLISMGLSLPESGVISPSIMITALPQLLSGGLLLIAGMLARKATAVFNKA